MKRLLSCFVCGLVLLCLCAASILPAPARAAEEARPVPTLSMEGLHTLLQATGNRVVVINFFASWCPPCREEVPELIALRKEYPAQQVDIIGISLDSNSAALNAFAARQGFNYPVFMDDGSIARELGVGSIPLNIVLDGAGTLIYSAPGMISKEELKGRIDAALKP